MKKIIINSLSEIAEIMYLSVTKNKLCKDVVFAGFYEDVTEIIKYLLKMKRIYPAKVHVSESFSDTYKKEYYLSLDRNMNIWCEPAYSDVSGCYLNEETDFLFIADDCNSIILKHVDCDENKKFEISYDLEGCECGNGCECCCSDTEKDLHEVITRVATDENGKLKGFEKSWETFEDGLHYQSTYSFFSSNEDMLKSMLESFDIKY